MIKRVVTITSGIESLVDKINDFIKNELKENEYVKDVKIVESYRKGRTKESYLVGGGTWTHQIVYYTACIYVGGLKNEME